MDGCAISVVIPARNEETFLPNCLASLRAQDFKKPFEIIVVDNGSSDLTASIAKKFDAKVVYEKISGVGRARHKGCMTARGNIIATTDADTILPVNWLSIIDAQFSNNPSLVAFGGLYTLYSGTWLARISFLYIAKYVWIIDKYIHGGWSIPGVNMAFCKDAYEKIGGFNTDFMIFEDADLAHRLRTVGTVLLDPNFCVKTSGRRYSRGVIRGLLDYFPSYVVRTLTGKHKLNSFREIEKREQEVPTA